MKTILEQIRDWKRIDWQDHLETLRLSYQGISASEISRRMGVSRQVISTRLKRMSNLSVKEAEAICEYLGKLTLDTSK